MPDVVLALDQGTTGTTALAITRRGEIIGRAYAELPQHYPRPGWVEHDAEDIWRSAIDTLIAAIDDAGVAPRNLRALGITNQRETTVVWHRETGRPIHHAIVWQSRQSIEQCQRLTDAGHTDTIRRKTGLVIDAYFSATKIRWLLDQRAEWQARAEAGDLLFGTVDSWLLYRLTGGAVHATEATNAARTLLFDIHDKRWDDELLAINGVPRVMMPQVMPSSSEVFGETTGQGSLPAGVPISGIAGDQQAALFGQGCWQPGQAKNTYGTGCFLLMNMGDTPAASEHGLLTTLGCDQRGRPVYCLEGSVFTAGSAVQWLRDELRMISRAEETESLALSVEDTRGVFLVPAFAGLGAPYWDMEARGTLSGLTRGAGRAHIVRATLESIAYQTRDVLDAMTADSGVELTELRVDGGASANDFLMQFQADILGLPVDRPRAIETTAMGAAFLAGLAVGFWQDAAELAEARRRQRLFTPDMAEDEREQLYDGWHQAVERTRFKT